VDMDLEGLARGLYDNFLGMVRLAY
jgi:hypothetical protein